MSASWSVAAHVDYFVIFEVTQSSFFDLAPSLLLSRQLSHTAVFLQHLIHVNLCRVLPTVSLDTDNYNQSLSAEKTSADRLEAVALSD